jgi:glycosyltransferase involved in cell wall biosynthesis
MRIWSPVARFAISKRRREISRKRKQGCVLSVAHSERGTGAPEAPPDALSQAPGKHIRVLHFCNGNVRAGVEEHLLLLLRLLDRRLFRLHLVCPPGLLEKFRPDLPGDVEAVPLSFLSPFQAGAAVRFARVLLDRDVDIVHSHMFGASLAASPVARLCRIPVTVETAHVREHWRKGWFKSKYFADRVAGRFVSDYIAVSKATGKYLTEEKRLPVRKVTVIPNGCDVAVFHPGNTPRVNLRGRLGLNENDPVLVVSARLEPQKGHRILLEALPSVLRDFPNVKIVCLGEGQLRGDLEHRTRTLGLSRTVFFVGYESNVTDWLALAEFTILPSFYEGLPLSAIESLAAGRTVVATAVDGTSEVVIDRQTGLTVPPGNACLLAESIKTLLRDSDLRRNLAARGRQWVEQKFSQDQQVRQTERLYVRALARGRRDRGKQLPVELP